MPFDEHDYPQVIPTPAYARAGGPAPWQAVSPESRRGIGLARVRHSLADAGRLFDQGPPPSEPAELAVVADGDPRAVTRRSAVLAALFEEAGEARLVLTRRALELTSHSGEVALPGGRSEEHESATDTAVREAHEEIGLDPDAVELVGWLTPIVTFASGSAIQPVVGVLSERPTLVANPAEVGRVFDVALTSLLADGNFLEQRWRRDAPRPGAAGDGTFPIYFFRVPGEVIWGATARVITELLSIVTGVAPPGPRWVIG